MKKGDKIEYKVGGTRRKPGWAPGTIVGVPSERSSTYEIRTAAGKFTYKKPHQVREVSR